MLGPMAFKQAPGPHLRGDEIVYAEGGCGGCGGCGAGCGSGAGGADIIKNSATVRIVGESTLATVREADKGTADERQSTFTPSAYSAEHRSRGLLGESVTPVPYMQEGVISQALWAELQRQIQFDLEPRLVPLANQFEPLSCCEWVESCCGDSHKGAIVRTNDIISTLIEATRSEYLATVNLRLDALPCPPKSSGAARKVVLNFGGENDAYYLVMIDAPGDSAEEKLQEAQAALREALAKYQNLGLMPSSSAAVAPVVEPGVPLQQQPMMVTVPDGLSGGQSLTVQTPAGTMAVQIPPGLSAGQSFQIQVPLQAQPVVVAPVVQEMHQA